MIHIYYENRWCLENILRGWLFRVYLSQPPSFFNLPLGRGSSLQSEYGSTISCKIHKDKIEKILGKKMTCILY